MTILRIAALLIFLLTYSGTASAQSDLPSTVKLSPITDPAEKAETVSEIRKDVRREMAGAQVVRCSELINYVKDMPAGHDSSFGAVCKVNSAGKIKRIILCDDRMLGKFFAGEQVVRGIEQIGLFIGEHCPPGG